MQIATRAKIEKCGIKKGSNELKFKDLKLTSRQVEHISDLINGDEEVEITIVAVQGSLLPDESKLTESKGKKKDGKKAASGEND